ncbi:MAG: hypothetical protein HFI76_05365 [Lachnospiraceae bacterium]|nr:hypothetical protein [Lachnospiraceae bacterium]
MWGFWKRTAKQGGLSSRKLVQRCGGLTAERFHIALSLDPQETNYCESDNPAMIASHLASKIRMKESAKDRKSEDGKNVMNVKGNITGIQYVFHNVNGGIQSY